MRSFSWWAVSAVVLVAAGEAEAQFANRSLGLSAGYVRLNQAAGLDWGVPLSLEASLYIENRFELVVRFAGMLLTQPITGTQMIGVAPNLGVRYLLLEEQLRPYLGLDTTYLHIFSPVAVTDYFGLSPNAGVDYFVSDSVSIGGRAMVNVYFALNQPLQTGIGAVACVATYF